MKLFEYLALGLAIVAPSTSNIREILDDGDNALLFDPQSQNQLFEHMRHLRDDRQLRERIGRNASATIQKRGLTWTRNAERVCELFTNLGVPSTGQANRTTSFR